LSLHGFTDSWFSFARVLDDLPSDVRAVAPSQRGHGDSERPLCCYHVSDFAKDAVALLDALGIERATVVGHSMGSFVARRVAAEHPTRVARLVLIGSGTTARKAAVIDLNHQVQKLADPVPPDFVREFQASALSKPIPPTFLDRVVRESQKVPARVWRDVLAGLIGPEAQNRLERIGASTLIVWGDKDAYWVRSDQDDLLGAISGARLVTYPGVGHSPHTQRASSRDEAARRHTITFDSVPPAISPYNAMSPRLVSCRLGWSDAVYACCRSESD
jgi:non-heme chloroperoxidase